MSKKPRAKYHVRKRIFLNRRLEMCAFAVGIVEDTREIPNENEDDWKWGRIELMLGDCYRHVSYAFNMDTKENRADSLYKIRRIAEIVNAVRDAMEIEAESIDQRKAPKPEAKAESAAG
jgi:hypothetical protein